MIRSFEVKGLNKRFSPEVPLKFHEDLNIFTGVNGSGKTTLLKLIWYLISGHLDRILARNSVRFCFHCQSRTDLSRFELVTSLNPGQVTLDSSFGKKEGLSVNLWNLLSP